MFNTQLHWVNKADLLVSQNAQTPNIILFINDLILPFKYKIDIKEQCY